MTGAFGGDQRRKEALLFALAAAIRDDNRSFALLVPHGTDLTTFAADHAIDAASAELIAAIDRLDGGREDENGAVLTSLFEAINPGASTRTAVHRWIIWAWEEAPRPVSHWIDDAAAVLAAEEVIALHRMAAAGVDVADTRWRPVRSALRSATTEDRIQAAALDIVGAAAWDLGQAPGAAGDVVVAWRALIEHAIDIDVGWTAEDEAEFPDRIRALNALTRQMGGFTDDPAMRRKALLDARREAVAADDTGFHDRLEQRAARRAIDVPTLQRTMIDGLVHEFRDLPARQFTAHV